MTISNEVIIGAESVVTKDVPNNCIVVGNPAKIIKQNIRCARYGVFMNEDSLTSEKYYNSQTLCKN